MKETTTAVADQAMVNPSIGFPYEIKFADSDASPATAQLIETYLARLSQRYDRIVDCNVFVRIPHHGPKLFHVHVQLDVPGKRLATSRDAEPNDSHTSIQTAVKDSFKKIMRQLDDYVTMMRDHKPH